jgi:hypothetical protein
VFAFRDRLKTLRKRAPFPLRVDPLNFYSFGRVMRTDAPSLCPGDSGGPVLRDGKAVGVHGTAHGAALRYGANSNMSVNLNSLMLWSALESNANQSSRSGVRR